MKAQNSFPPFSPLKHVVLLLCCDVSVLFFAISRHENLKQWQLLESLVQVEQEKQLQGDRCGIKKSIRKIFIALHCTILASQNQNLTSNWTFRYQQEVGCVFLERHVP